jgi:hypothetical protein
MQGASLPSRVSVIIALIMATRSADQTFSSSLSLTSLQEKQFFSFAKDSANLNVKLTAAMGKRTKHQIPEHARLLLVAKSNLVAQDSQSDAMALDQVIFTQSKVEKKKGGG